MRNDFFDLLKRLTDADVDFVIVGGFAGVVYGCTYVTQDIKCYMENPWQNK